MTLHSNFFTIFKELLCQMIFLVGFKISLRKLVREGIIGMLNVKLVCLKYWKRRIRLNIKN
jgi:hypothetical protein